MKNLYQPVVEIKAQEVRVAIAKFCVETETFIVLQKDRKLGTFIENDCIVNRDVIVKFLTERFHNFEVDFKIPLEKVAVVIPDNGSKPVQERKERRLSTPRPILADDFRILKEEIRAKYANSDKRILEMYEQRKYVDNVETKNDWYVNRMGGVIALEVLLITADSHIWNDHISIIKECGKKIASVSTTSISYNSLFKSRDKLVINTIVNWENDKITISFFLRDILIKVAVLKNGINDLLVILGKTLNTTNTEVLKRYAFKMFNFSTKTPNTAVYYRKVQDEYKLELTHDQIKNTIAQIIRTMLKKIDTVIRQTVTSWHEKPVIYHVGKINKFAGHETLLDSSVDAQYHEYWSLSLVGSNENWTIPMQGVMLSMFKREATQYLRQKSEEARLQAAHQRVLMPQRNGVQGYGPQPVIQQHYGTQGPVPSPNQAVYRQPQVPQHPTSPGRTMQKF